MSSSESLFLSFAFINTLLTLCPQFRLLGKLWTFLSAGSSIDQRGPEVCQLIEQAKYHRQSAPTPSPDDKKSRLPSSSASFQYALGAGEVERAAPVVQKEYDPYEEADDGYDPYDDD